MRQLAAGTKALEDETFLTHSSNLHNGRTGKCTSRKSCGLSGLQLRQLHKKGEKFPYFASTSYTLGSSEIRQKTQRCRKNAYGSLENAYYL